MYFPCHNIQNSLTNPLHGQPYLRYSLFAITRHVARLPSTPTFDNGERFLKGKTFSFLAINPNLTTLTFVHSKDTREEYLRELL